MTKCQVIVLGKKPIDAKWVPMWLHSFEAMETFIEGDLEEINFPLGIKLFCNAEFLLLKNEVNLVLSTSKFRLPEPILGNVFLATKNEHGQIASLTDNQLEWIYENSEVIELPTFKNPVFQFTYTEGGL